MYKDKDRQREAQRNWVRQKRANKGSTAPPVICGVMSESTHVKPIDGSLSITEQTTIGELRTFAGWLKERGRGAAS